MNLFIFENLMIIFKIFWNNTGLQSLGDGELSNMNEALSKNPSCILFENLMKGKYIINNSSNAVENIFSSSSLMIYVLR